MKSTVKKSSLDAAFKKIRKSLAWTSSNGESVLISDMSKNHLQNTIIFLAKKQEECTKYKVGDFEVNGMTANEWIDILRQEWASRD